ncbi:MAG: thioredoxin family protein [Synergistaceae bacterium]|nr:thioredoxin family protein [Synergistaceae bacterium]
MSKVLDSINEKYADMILAEKIDISNKLELATEFKVRYVPHLLFVDAKGEVFKQEIGFRSEDDVIEAFEKVGIKIR